jgi:hypothetical protein
VEQEKYARLRHLVENAKLAKKIGPQVEALIFLMSRDREGSRQAQINHGKRIATVYAEILEQMMENAKSWKARN